MTDNRTFLETCRTDTLLAHRADLLAEVASVDEIVAARTTNPIEPMPVASPPVTSFGQATAAIDAWKTTQAWRDIQATCTHFGDNSSAIIAASAIEKIVKGSAYWSTPGPATVPGWVVKGSDLREPLRSQPVLIRFPN